MTKKRKRKLNKLKQAMRDSTANPTDLRLKASLSAVHRKVRELARQGKVEDEIARAIRSDKNQLRRHYIDELKEGRAAARAASDAASGEELSVEEETQRKALFAGYGSPRWDGPDGNPLQNGRTLEETEALWQEWLRLSRSGKRTLPVHLPGLYPER